MIGALVFSADGSQTIYTEQHLHPGEDVVFSAGSGGIYSASGLNGSRCSVR